MYPKDESGITVRDALDDRTDGALYALQFEAKKNEWEPHIWAQKLQGEKTRFIFYATDHDGRTRYFDYATAQDTENLGALLQIAERAVEIKKAKTRIHEGLARLDHGLDPVEHRVDTERLD